MYIYIYIYVYIYIYILVKKSTNRHMGIINLFQITTHKNNESLQIAITQWREKNL